MQRAGYAGFCLVVLCSCDDSMLGLGGSSPGCIPAEEFGAESGPIEDDFLPSDSPMRGGSGRPTKRICRTPMVASKPLVRPAKSPSEPWTLVGVSQSTAATDRAVTLRIFGTALRAGDTVFVGGKAVATRYLSSIELEIDVPARADLFGATLIEVRRASGLSIKRSDLLRYVSVDLGFNRLTISCGYSPTSIAVADFNNDSHLDITSSNLLDPEVYVVFGDGAGSFPSLETTIPDDPLDTPRSYDVVAGDWDGDGHEDLAFAQGASREVRVLWGNGKGWFPQSTRIAMENMPFALASADVDRDGWLDLIVVGREPDKVVVLHNPHRRTFEPMASLSTGKNPFGLAMAKLRSDSPSSDLIVSNETSGDVSVYLSHPSGGFLPSSAVSMCPDPRGVATGDIDHDGKIDLIVACQKSGEVCLGFGDGIGGFGRKKRCIPVSPQPISVMVKDLDGDGHLDLAVAHYQGGLGQIGYGSILRGVGDGSFLAAEPLRTGRNSTRIIAADFNGDGRPDLAVSNLSNGYTTVHIHSATK